MASAGVSAKVYLSGFRELRSVLKQEPVPAPVARAWRRFMERLTDLGLRQVQAASPRGATGALRAGNTSAVMAGPFPLWGRVKNTARAKPRPAKRQNKKVRAGLAAPRLVQGYRYPGRTARDKRFRTYLWWQNAVRAAQRGAPRLLNQTAREMEEEWGHTFG